MSSVQAQWLVLGVFEEDAEPAPALRGTALEPIITRLIADKDLTGSPGELLALHGLAGLQAGAVLLVGLGHRRRFDSGAAYSAGFAFAKRLAGKRRDAVAVVLPPADAPLRCASALIEGAVAGTRGPGVRKTRSGSACL